MKLYYRTYGSGHPLVILHGLLGSGGNWHSLSKKFFAKKYQVVALDQRNHGRSGHSEDFSYDAMAADLLELMDDLEFTSAHLLGHSMGGKTAMHFALLHPERVDGLVLADIAPVDYPYLHRDMLDALQDLDLTAMKTREQIDQAMAIPFPDYSVRQFLLKGVIRGKKGFKWTFNLDAINRGYPSLVKAVLGWQPFEGPTLFVRGGKSKYVLDEHVLAIRTQFPYAEIATMENAGHWLHADDPEQFGRLVMSFLDRI